MRSLLGVLALAVMPSVGSAQATRRPIPRELFGYRLGATLNSLPDSIRARCRPRGLGEHGEPDTRNENEKVTVCSIGAGRELHLNRDRIVRSTQEEILSRAEWSRTPMSSDSIWRTRARPRALQQFGRPDSVWSDSAVRARRGTLARHTTAIWDRGGPRTVEVSVWIQADVDVRLPVEAQRGSYWWVVITSLYCKSTWAGGWTAADVDACAQGDRP